MNRADKIPVLKGAYSTVGESETTIITYIRKVFPAEQIYLEKNQVEFSRNGWGRSL